MFRYYALAYLFNRNIITCSGGKLYQVGYVDDLAILLQNIKVDNSGIVPF